MEPNAGTSVKADLTGATLPTPNDVDFETDGDGQIPINPYRLGRLARDSPDAKPLPRTQRVYRDVVEIHVLDFNLDPTL